MEKSLQRLRPRHDDTPACQARRAQDTNWVSAPSRPIRKCAETRNAAIVAKYACADGSRRLVNNSAIAGPPNCPGGSEMLWTTSSVIATPSGRSSELGEGTCAAARTMPARSTKRRVRKAAHTLRVFNSPPFPSIPHLPEGDAQEARRPRPGVAALLHRLVSLRPA